MNNKLYVAKIVGSTSTDGMGLRSSLYVSGCHLRCKGCHNSRWWDLKSGEERDIDDVYEELIRDGFNISILGGEPLMQYNQIVKLCKKIKENTDRTIWLFTGYELPYIEFFFGDILKYVDVIVDGPYREDLRDTNLHFRGSSNQRIYKVESHSQINIFDISEFYK